MRILIDADGCPVVELTLAVAAQFHSEVILFCDTAHALHWPGVPTVTVEKGPDSVDFALINRLEGGGYRYHSGLRFGGYVFGAPGVTVESKRPYLYGGKYRRFISGQAYCKKDS